jgi:hypothetical protein
MSYSGLQRKILENLCIPLEYTGETEVLGENLLHCRFVHHLTRARTWVTTVGSWQLTTRAMAWPPISSVRYIKYTEQQSDDIILINIRKEMYPT